MKDRDNLAKALARLVLVTILVVCGLQVFPAYAQQKVYKWRWVGSIPKALTQMPIWEEMCNEITRRSGGRLVVQALHLGEHPYKGEEILSVVRDGLAEMGHSEGVYVTGEEVFMAAMDLPFLIPTMDQALRIKDRWVCSARK